MQTRTVSCESCDHTWDQAGGQTVYEREAIESRPCPSCEAYTLASPEPAAPSRRSRRGPYPVPPKGAKRAA